MHASPKVTSLKIHGNKLLRVNLSKGKITSTALEKNTSRGFVGGKALGIKILLEETNPQLEPLSPANTLIFLTRPVNGTLLSGAAKFGVFSSSL